MAKFTEGTTVELPNYRILMSELEKLTTDKKLIARKMGTAMRYATKPSYQAFVGNLSKVGEKTGNLKRAAQIKVKSYSQSGNAVALVGYVRPGSDASKKKGKGRDRAYHQGFLEFGTKERHIKGPIASSYRSGIFSIAKAGGSLKTTNYPRSFFKRGPATQALSVGRMPVGGRFGRPPLKDAFDKTKGQINQRLGDRTQKVVDSLLKSLKKAESK